MHSIRLAVLLLLLTPNLQADDADPLPVPEDWRSEVMEMPPPFATALEYDGQLHVKFSPTWQKFDAADGWTYAFVWRVAPTAVDAERLESDLEAYFGGLMTAVGSERFPDKGIPSVASLEPMPPGEPWTKAWQGTVRTWNPFHRGEAVELHFEIRSMTCQGAKEQTLLFLVSKAATDAPVWDSLRSLIPGARC